MRHKANTLSAYETIVENGGHLVLVEAWSKAPGLVGVAAPETGA